VAGVDVAGVDVDGAARPADGHSADAGIGDGVIVLRANHRFGGALATLAGAVRGGEVDEAMAVLAAGDPAVGWLAVDQSAADPAGDDAALAPVRRLVAESAAAMFDAASAGDGGGALDALDRFRVLCAHRRGPAGVSTWTPRIEGWLTASIEGFAPVSPWYLGRPVMVTANDYALRLFNGDTGVVIARPDEGVAVAVRRADGPALLSPARLAGVDTVFAMTVHKAQGSEFDEVIVVLPDADSALLTRELLYTAVTRARRRLVVVGSEASVRAAVARPIARASGLTARLWP
jgi:exodeoxyribonuclease V alpha subunit